MTTSILEPLGQFSLSLARLARLGIRWDLGFEHPLTPTNRRQA
jgi:hypothetical protein